MSDHTISRKHILDLLQAHRDELHERFGISRLALFGSVARDEATPQSDVDLLVEYDRPAGFLHLSRTKRFLESILALEHVDVVTFNGMRPSIQEKVMMEAIHV